MSDEINEISSNSMLSNYYIKLAEELEVLDPKHPSDIYKTHLQDKKGNIDSAKANLASTYVSAFVNCGLKKDKLLMAENETTPWPYKVSGDGQVAAIASYGLLDLWDYDTGSTHIAPYLDI